jgi:glycosyltransferase 2 family protein
VDDEGSPVTEVTATQPQDASPAPQPTGRARTASWRRAALLAARIVFTVAVIAAVAYTTVRQWPDVRDTLTRLAWQSVALSLLMVVVGLGAQTLAWRAALNDMGHRVGVRTASQIFLIGLLAKYLPGSFWSFVLQMELGRRAKLPRSRALLASIVGFALSSATALALGVFGLPVLFHIDVWTTVLVLTVLPIVVVCAHPRVLTWLIQRLLAATRRPPLEAPISWRGVGAVVGWCVVGWVCFGAHLWLLANAESAPGFVGLLRCVGAFALGLTAGQLAFLSPSGLGVREAIIAAALLPYVPAGVALGMALASRMVFTVGDLAAAGLAALSGLRASRRLTGS